MIFKLSRNRFLVGSAAALAALTGPPAAAAAPGTKTVMSGAHWGAFTVTVRNGAVVGLEPFSGDVAPTALQSATADLLTSPVRIRYPMVRQGFYRKRHASDASARGAEPFVRVSWDEAIAIVSEELARVKATFGNASIYGGSYGWQSAGVFHGARPALQRMLGMYGGFVPYVNTYSAPVLPVITPHVLGDARPKATAWPVIVANSDLVVFFGYNPAVNAEVRSGGLGSHDDMQYVAALKARGTPVVSINPVVSETDAFLGTEHHAIRPNTDTALLLALAYVIYTEKLHNATYLAKYTVGFEKFVPYLTGAADGVPKTPQWAAAITQIDAATIATLARRMAKGRTILMGGFSLQRADHGAQPVWAMIALAAMLGQIGLPGGGVQIDFPGGLGVPAGTAPIVPGLPGGANPVKDYVPVNMWTDMLLNPGKTIDYDGKKITYPDTRLVWWAGGNPLHHAHDVNRVVAAWRRPEVTIVNDYNWTATAKYADVVLPATTMLERNDIISTDRFTIAVQQAVSPQFEARNDFDIFAAIAKRLGFEAQFTEGKTEDQWLRGLYAIAQKQALARSLAFPDFDAFWQRGYLEFPPTDATKSVVAYSAFHADPASDPLGTPSGKIEIFSDAIASYGYDDCPGHPTWLAPFEWLGSPKVAHFPLHALSSHPKGRLHSQLDNTALRQTYEVAEREPVWMHPDDAAARNISAGDVVRVFNDRGSLLAGAVLTDAVRRSVVVVHEGAWYDPLEPGQIGTLDKHGSANAISSDRPDSKLADGNPSNTALVQIERYAGPAPPVTAFVPPRSARA